MERINRLGRYPKIILLILAVMVLVFTILYPIVTARVGFLYEDAILVPSEKGGSIVYSGKIHGLDAHFTVSADKTVIFQCGDAVYGPYTAREDPTAIPKDTDSLAPMTGIELRCAGEIIFRGGVVKNGDWRFLYNEDGSSESIRITAGMSDGTVVDMDGNRVDPMEPSLSAILDLMEGPALTHKGAWIGWLGGMLICALAVVSILFADELFRWNASFLVRNVSDAEPSDWEIASRYITWTALPVMALVVFILGLQ